MEAVLLSTAATQVALYALNLRAARPPPQPAAPSSAAADPAVRASSDAPTQTSGSSVDPVPDAQPAPAPDTAGVPDEPRREVARKETVRESADEEVDLTATIESLEAEIKALRAQATYSADTLVSASRADRKANELEAKLKALRGTPNASEYQDGRVHNVL